MLPIPLLFFFPSSPFSTELGGDEHIFFFSTSMEEAFCFRAAILARRRRISAPFPSSPQSVEQIGDDEPFFL